MAEPYGAKEDPQCTLLKFPHKLKTRQFEPLNGLLRLIDMFAQVCLLWYVFILAMMCSAKHVKGPLPSCAVLAGHVYAPQLHYQ